MTEDRILQEAIEAIEKGQRARARDLFTRILRKEPAREDCWLYMSAVVETTKERIFCLENVLKYDPENQTALQGLVMMGKLPPDENIVHVRPENERSKEDIKIFEVEQEKEESPRKKLRRSRSTPGRQIVATVVIAIAALSLIFIGIFGNPFAESSGGLIALPGQPTATFAPLAAAALPTATPRPSATPEPEKIVSNIALPTPLNIRVEEPFTPTPMYVNTPHPNNEAFSAAMSSFNFANYGQALALFEQAREQMGDSQEDDLDARYYIGLIYIEMGELEDARREFDLILQEEPLFVAAYTARARAKLLMTSDAVVAADLYKAVGIDPEHTEGYLLIAEYRLNREELSDALWACEQLLKYDPDNPRGLHYLAEVYLAEGDYELALETAQRAYDLDITMEDNYYTLGRALIENGREQEGYGYMELYVHDNEDALEDRFVLYYLGRAFQGFDDHIRAIENFEASYDIHRGIYEMSYYWSLSLIALKDYDGAADRAIVPIQQIPTWFEPYVAHAQALFYQEAYSDAKETIEEGADLAKTESQQAELYYWRGKIYDELGYPSIAEGNWEKLMDLSPEFVPTFYLREAQERILVPDFTPGPTDTPAQPTPTRVTDG